MINTFIPIHIFCCPSSLNENIFIINLLYFLKYRLESLRKHARRRLGLDIFKPVKPSIFNDDDYVITPETTALKATASSNARAKATEIQKSKVFINYNEISYL